MDGVHPDLVSQQTGVAESTLRKHYAKWIHTSDRDAVELAKIERKSVAKPEAKTGYYSLDVVWRSRRKAVTKYLKQKRARRDFTRLHTELPLDPSSQSRRVTH